MIDRTDLQLMLVEQLFKMDTDDLIDWFQRITGEEMELYNVETDEMIGSVETLNISDPPQLKKMLGFLIYALGERVEMPVED